MHYHVKDTSLAVEGTKKIDWAEAHMPVLVALKHKYQSKKPLEGIKIAGCLHVTKETGVLVRVLQSVGAELAWCGCNPLSTQDDVAASLAIDEHVSVFARRGISTKEYYDDIHSVIGIGPNITIIISSDSYAKWNEEMENMVT